MRTEEEKNLARPEEEAGAALALLGEEGGGKADARGVVLSTKNEVMREIRAEQMAGRGRDGRRARYVGLDEIGSLELQRPHVELSEIGSIAHRRERDRESTLQAGTRHTVVHRTTTSRRAELTSGLSALSLFPPPHEGLSTTEAFLVAVPGARRASAADEAAGC